MKPKYYVYTYDWDLGIYTPQQGVKAGPYTLFGLRKALRALGGMGYEIGRQANDVLVEREYKKGEVISPGIVCKHSPRECRLEEIAEKSK